MWKTAILTDQQKERNTMNYSYNYIISREGKILDDVAISNCHEAEEVERNLEDGESLLSAGQLTVDQIWEYMDNAPTWDDEHVEALAREIAERYDMDLDKYETYDDLMEAIDEQMTELIKETARDDIICDCLMDGDYCRDMTIEEAEKQLKDHRQVDSRISIKPEVYRDAYNEVIKEDIGIIHQCNVWHENKCIWYAVMADRDDTDWGFGSHDKSEALQMARNMDNPDAYVVIVDGDVAIGEINLDGEEIR